MPETAEGSFWYSVEEDRFVYYLQQSPGRMIYQTGPWAVQTDVPAYVELPFELGNRLLQAAIRSLVALWGLSESYFPFWNPLKTQVRIDESERAQIRDWLARPTRDCVFYSIMPGASRGVVLRFGEESELFKAEPIEGRECEPFLIAANRPHWRVGEFDLLKLKGIRVAPEELESLGLPEWSQKQRGWFPYRDALEEIKQYLRIEGRESSPDPRLLTESRFKQVVGLYFHSNWALEDEVATAASELAGEPWKAVHSSLYRTIERQWNRGADSTVTNYL